MNLVAKCFLLLALNFAGILKLHAQLNSFHSGYFQNQYLINPAMAGADKGLRLNMSLQQQFNSLPGGPKLQNYTADYDAGGKVGVGLNIDNNQAGLIQRTRVMGTYAYHLLLNEEDKLSFGLSLGINNTFLDPSAVNGDQGDISVLNYNQRALYVDGDFGASYSRQGFTIQAVIPNLKNAFFGSKNYNLQVDRSTFYTSASYKIPLSNEFSLEPKAAFRGINGSKNIIDAGVNFTMVDYNLNVSGIYHSNQSATLGLGLDLKNFGFLLAYTTNSGPLRTYLNNIFEIGLQIKLFNQ